MDKDSIIFDLDGTLWNSSVGVSESWSEELRKHNYKRKSVTVEEVSSYMGLMIDAIAERMFPELDIDIRNSIMKKCCERENKYLSIHGGVLYSDIEDTLRELSNKYKLIIVSNCQSGYIESFYKAHGLEKYFIDYECPGRTGLTKSENIRLVIERNNLKNPIYVGDTNGDFIAAKSAGVPFVYAKYGFGKVEDFQYSIDNFKALLKIF